MKIGCGSHAGPFVAAQWVEECNTKAFLVGVKSPDERYFFKHFLCT